MQTAETKWSSYDRIWFSGPDKQEILTLLKLKTNYKALLIVNSLHVITVQSLNPMMVSRYSQPYNFYANLFIIHVLVRTNQVCWPNYHHGRSVLKSALQPPLYNRTVCMKVTNTWVQPLTYMTLRVSATDANWIFRLGLTVWRSHPPLTIRRTKNLCQNIRQMLKTNFHTISTT
jgi:hypothetical protein